MRKVNPVKHAEKRGEILEAARRCFARDGFRGTSISTICAEAAISPGHLYHYFESKEAILGAIVQMVLEETAEHFRQALEGSEGVASLIIKLQRAKAESGRDPHLLVLDMFAEAGRNPALAQVLHEHSQGMKRLLADLLRKGQAHRQIDPGLDPEMAAMLLIGVLDGSKVMAVRNPSLDRRRMIDLLHLLIVRFLSPQLEVKP